MYSEKRSAGAPKYWVTLVLLLCFATALYILYGNLESIGALEEGAKLEKIGDSSHVQILAPDKSASISFISGLDDILMNNKAQALNEISFTPKTYASYDTDAVKGYMPDEALFGESFDPDEITQLLASPFAQHLLNGQTTAWNQDIELLPDTPVRYYLDETILALVWQEETYNSVGTFAEIVISDGSQFRRKLTDDYFGSPTRTAPEQLARETNAVLAVSGDMYGQWNRSNGIQVYNREICFFEPYSSDTCFVTSSGELLFIRAKEITDLSEAQRFVNDNDIVFSFAFGPVLIEDYNDVTPLGYTYGEIYDRYARAAIGALGEHHYLTLNVNFLRPAYPNYLTLFEATDIMLTHGCERAYALDGGMTACTVLNGTRINPVNGEERELSDMLYFVTSIPD